MYKKNGGFSYTGKGVYVKKKQILFVLLVVMLTLSFAFINCGEDSAGDANIVGTWEYKATHAEIIADDDSGFFTSEMLTLMGIPNPVLMLKLVCSDSGTFTFYDVDVKEGTEEKADSGTYKVDGNKVTFTSDKGETQTGIINGNKLTLTEDGETIVLTKK
jgi:hypothetical protein